MSTFWTDKGFEQLGDEIYVYKQFLSPEEVEKYKILIDHAVANNLWDNEMDHPFFKGRVTSNIQELEEVRNKMINLIGQDYKLGPNISASVLRTGDHWDVHFDAHDFIEKRKISATVKDDEEYTLIDDSKYGTVVYFNEFEGGNLFYPKQNISYHPNPGDLMLHSSEEFCEHGVSEIIKGPRYGLSGHLSQPMKFPKDYIYLG